MGCTNSGTVSDLIIGLLWVSDNHASPAVANISITASGNSSALDSTVNALVNDGVTVVAAAGNFNADACTFSPASASSAITVGATSTADYKATFSNFGSCVDIWAPGIAITSASNGDDTSFRVMNGTSMSSPHVAGVAALYLATHPTASPATVSQSIVNSATNGAILDLDSASPNKMVYSLFGGTPPPPSEGATVTGRVVSTNGRAVRGVSVTLQDSTTGNVREVVTNTFGYFSFGDLPLTHFYVLTADSTRRYPIQENVQSFTLEGDLTVRSFVTSRN
ncbi:MAG: S8 family serine peptidase [Pyrinomonadaceae bacterium]